MFQELQQLFQVFILTPVHDLANTLSGGDPMARGLVVIAILGSLIALCRNLPGRLWKMFKIKTMVSMSFRNDTRDVNQMAFFSAVSDFIYKHSKLKNYLIQSPPLPNETLKVAIGPANVNHWFFHKGNIFFYSRTAKKGVEEETTEPETLTLSWFGKGADDIRKILNIGDEMFLKPKTERYYQINDRGVPRIAGKINATNKIIISEKVRVPLIAALDRFKNERQWYLDRGLTHKFVVVFYGPPGTGKTSLTRFVADYLGFGIVVPRGDMLNDTYFPAAISDSGAWNLVVSLQDFDALDGFKNRSMVMSKEEKGEMNIVSSSSLKLSTVLNTFQGDIPLDKVVVVMTTNHLEKIDPAVYRPGRVELCLEIGPFEFAEVQEFYAAYFKTEEILPDSFKNVVIPSSRLMDIFTRHCFDSTAFKQELSEHVPITQETKKLLETV